MTADVTIVRRWGELAGKARSGTDSPGEQVRPPLPESLAVPNTERVLRSDVPSTSRIKVRPLPHIVTTAALALKSNRVVVDSAVLQIWEGVVKQVDRKAAAMDVLLTAKMGNERPHTAEIGLEWVAEQDLDLVRPGAVFYLTLYKRTEKGSVQNSQELRFRRRPAWNRQQVAAIRREADQLGHKLAERPRAD
jgi:hypothetical protein